MVSGRQGEEDVIQAGLLLGEAAEHGQETGLTAMEREVHTRRQH